MKTVTIDGGGRVVIPKPLRDVLKLEAGDRLEVEYAGEAIVLRPVGETNPLQKERGYFVYRTGKPMKESAITEWIDHGRKTRGDDIIR